MFSQRSEKYKKRSIVFLLIGLPIMIISSFVVKNSYLQFLGAAVIFLAIWFGLLIIKDYFVTKTEQADQAADI